jgi:hypothetical protein
MFGDMVEVEDLDHLAATAAQLAARLAPDPLGAIAFFQVCPLAS